ncbi:thiol-disulfide oxidoreductase DCC family protein [Candidatus Nitronereus thalassa]|uniref:DCC1-like thiol-disulfide oxidoreductase family protein n=1 Tax=Candidatus Nitronereus thalassa TaxID=3020898 RepID=A0ABU3KBY2_9BACT|nr:DCC1-like thiol-disulfide oxidoreductase family protein [Candidatus Nitronereus thalassa]MDT7044020.1 DCC1-like thiol-disulfide oxidoreductase family protein [Candidatus Nitronereus thalassa]
MDFRDPSSPPDSNGPIILYDGTCHLCTKTVQFVIQRDHRKQFRFASLQSSFSDKFVEQNSEKQERLESMVLIIGDHVYRRSTAALMTAKMLDGWWPILAALLWIPKPLRDMFYHWLAKHRYQVLGKRETCWRPTPDLADRFLDT